MGEYQRNKDEDWIGYLSFDEAFTTKYWVIITVYGNWKIHKLLSN